MDQFFEVERFVELFNENGSMEVKWKGYSKRETTIGACSKLTVELVERLVDDLRHEFVKFSAYPKNIPIKGANECIQSVISRLHIYFIQ